MTRTFPRPEVIITHESDLDGLVAGVLLQRLARKLFNSDIRLEACNYNYWRQRELRERSGWITDLAFEPRLDKPNWVIVDHHVTETAPKDAVLVHDVNKSAGLLCYELCREEGLGSPALDRGTSSGAPDHDLLGNFRPAGAGVDMGAFELPEPTVAALVPLALLFASRRVRPRR